jgi:hypothetical protein
MSDAIIVRPMQYADRAYVFSVTRRMVLSRFPFDIERGEHAYERHLDVGAVRDLVDHLVSDCETRVVFIRGVGDDGRRAPEIQGFVVEARDASVEFVHLRKTYEDMERPDLAVAILRAMLNGQGEVVLRRHPSPTTMAALDALKRPIVVRPRAV